jgi:hypothetical protein
LHGVLFRLVLGDVDGRSRDPLELVPTGLRRDDRQQTAEEQTDDPDRQGSTLHHGERSS